MSNINQECPQETNASPRPGGYDFFALDPASVNDPWAFWDWVRSQSRAYKDPSTGVYIVTGYQDILEIGRSPEIFSSAVAATGHLTEFPGELKGEGEELQALLHSWRDDHKEWQVAFLSYDPPVHTRYRRMIAPLFSPARLAHTEAFIEQEATRLIDDFIADGECDFQEKFTDPLPLMVVSDLFGLADEFREVVSEHLKAGKEAVESGAVGELGSPDHSLGELLQGFNATRAELFMENMRARRDAPSDDVLSKIVNGEFFDTKVKADLDELLPVVQQVYGAGTDTTSMALRSGMRLLATNPSMADELRQDPSLIPNFVEELLRCHSSAKVLFRLAVEDTEIGGVSIPARSIICLAFQGGNRDPEQFPMPHNFDIRRGNAATHMGFGGPGDPHSCVGMHVARAQLRIGFKLLLERLDNIRLKADAVQPAPLQSFILHGPNSLSIEFDRV